MAQLGLWDMMSEDITIGTAVTYATGGITLTVTRGNQLLLVRSLHLKAPTGTAASTLGLVAAVFGSESGQTFKMKCYIAAGSASAFGELPNANALLEGLTVHVIYQFS